DSNPSLVVVEPTLFYKNYAPVLSESDEKYFADSKDEDLLFLCVAVLKENIKDSVINLKSPILIDSEKKKGRQIILENADYPIRYKIFEDR
nr:flagellar assembly protein FliW [Clostridiales bacterium]